MRIGSGYDVHRFANGKKLVLGGVEIPFKMGLEGHSDADVLLHAIMDALLGAAALGDIGTHFPDTDEKYKGVSSRILLREVALLLQVSGFVPVNIDSTIIAEAPKMQEYVDEMRKNIASDLGLDISCVSVKATTEEGLGFTGRREGMAATAVALVEQE